MDNFCFKKYRMEDPCLAIEYQAEELQRQEKDE